MMVRLRWAFRLTISRPHMGRSEARILSGPTQDRGRLGAWLLQKVGTSARVGVVRSVGYRPVWQASAPHLSALG